MRVELIYSPGCNLYKSVRDNLETVIAEEALPIPVEMVEDKILKKSPTIRIDGRVIDSQTGSHSLDNLRDVLCQKWRELTEHSLNRA